MKENEIFSHIKQIDARKTSNDIKKARATMKVSPRRQSPCAQGGIQDIRPLFEHEKVHLKDTDFGSQDKPNSPLY